MSTLKEERDIFDSWNKKADNPKESQKNRILAFLMQGNTITPLEALTKFGSFRLGARIYDLREDGYEIGSNTIETINGSHVSEYFLQSFQSGLH